MQLNAAARDTFVGSAASASRFPSLMNLLGPSCSTKRGRQCLKQWLERPCIDAVVLNQRLDTVDALVSAVAEGDAVLYKLSGLFQHVQSYERDLPLFLPAKMDNSADTKLTLSDFSGLLRWLTEFQARVEDCLGEEEGGENLYSFRLRPILQLVSRDLQPFRELINDTIEGLGQNSDPLTMEGDSEVDTRSSTSHLQELHREIRQCELEVTDAKEEVATVLTLPQDRIKIIYGDDEQQVIARVGVVFRVARQDSHRIQQQSGKAISVLRASKASGLWFTTPAIDTLGTKWKALKRSIEDAEAVLVDFLATEFQSRFQGVLDELARRVAELDVLVSFALVSHKHKFVRASTRKLQTGGAGAGGILRVHGMFDPFKQTTGDATEPCDEVAIELSLHSGKTFLLLDGDEKASCTRLLQLLGSVAILNQLGCCVPCRDAELPVFDAIYLRTGAYDQQLYGYSTFMTEMREMSLILSKTTPASLVLIEDLCRGTSTSEGLALALSMCVHLMASKTVTCFSSQWRELTDQLAQQSATTTPTCSHPSRSVGASSDSRLHDASQASAAFEEQMQDCELPPDLIALIRQELEERRV